jgi:drug/metabolite transporter (DMT)-like permease
MNPVPSAVAAALLAALLFGLSTPLAKRLVGDLAPLPLAGLLYLGSGIGLTALRLAWRSRAERGSGLSRADLPWLGGAILFVGLLGPVLLMAGLQTTPPRPPPCCSTSRGSSRRSSRGSSSGRISTGASRRGWP